MFVTDQDTRPSSEEEKPMMEKVLEILRALPQTPERMAKIPILEEILRSEDCGMPGIKGDLLFSKFSDDKEFTTLGYQVLIEGCGEYVFNIVDRKKLIDCLNSKIGEQHRGEKTRTKELYAAYYHFLNETVQNQSPFLMSYKYYVIMKDLDGLKLASAPLLPLEEDRDLMICYNMGLIQKLQAREQTPERIQKIGKVEEFIKSLLFKPFDPVRMHEMTSFFATDPEMREIGRSLHSCYYKVVKADEAMTWLNKLAENTKDKEEIIKLKESIGQIKYTMDSGKIPVVFDPTGKEFLNIPGLRKILLDEELLQFFEGVPNYSTTGKSLEIAKSKQRPSLKNSESQDVSKTAGYDSRAQMLKRQMKKASKERKWKEAEKVAKCSSGPINSRPEENNLPDPVECGHCKEDIQPKAKKYLRFTCGEDHVVWSYHKTCLEKHYGTTKKHWKGRPCPADGCDKTLWVVYEVDCDLEETVYIESDDKTTTKPEVQGRKIFAKEKNPEMKKEEIESVDETKKPESGPVVVELITRSLTPTLSHPVNHNSPRIPTDDEVVIPLQKEKDQAEEKYSVLPPTKTNRTKNQHQKKVLPVVFQTTTTHKKPGQVQTNILTKFDTEFPCSVGREVIFPLPGSQNSLEFQQNILYDIRSIIDYLPADLPDYEENKSESVASLFDRLVKTTEVLSSSQITYLEKLAQVDMNNGEQLRKFVSGLKNFMIEYNPGKDSWQYNLNKQGRELQQSVREQRELLLGPIIEECVICMVSVRDSHLREKCSHCNHQFHATCIEEWHKTKRTCPVCNRLMINEADFPDLFLFPPKS